MGVTSQKKNGDKKNAAKASGPAVKPQQLTATQLRNARKRRAKQKQKAGKKPQSSHQSGLHSDPSAQYLDRPKAAPLVQAAKRFFADILPNQFTIYQNGPKIGWRTVSKLPVRRDSGTKSKVVIGMFQPQSHTISSSSNNSNGASSITTYPAHHPSINGGTEALMQACQEKGIVPYDETGGTGYLRYIAMNVERSTGKVQLTLIWNDNPYSNLNISDRKKKRKKRKKQKTDNKNDDKSQEETQVMSEGKGQLERLTAHLLKEHFPKASEDDVSEEDDTTKSNNRSSFQLHSLWIHYNAAWKHSNAIFDIHASSEDAWRHICGPTTIVEELTCISKGLPYQPTLHFGPNVFRQANLDAFAHIVTVIRTRIQQQFSHKRQQKGVRVVELYGGVGTIGLHLLDLVSSCICSDENPHNRACFQSSVDALKDEEYAAKATYVPKNASDMVTDRRQFLNDCDVLIVDPPRKGLDETVVDALVKHGGNNLELLVYVSCGFTAFQRDYNALTKNQKWKLDHAEGHILFPGANAIETLAFFTRTK